MATKQDVMRELVRREAERRGLLASEANDRRTVETRAAKELERGVNTEERTLDQVVKDPVGFAAKVPALQSLEFMTDVGDRLRAGVANPILRHLSGERPGLSDVAEGLRAERLTSFKNVSQAALGEQKQPLFPQLVTGIPGVDKLQTMDVSGLRDLAIEIGMEGMIANVLSKGKLVKFISDNGKKVAKRINPNAVKKPLKVPEAKQMQFDLADLKKVKTKTIAEQRSAIKKLQAKSKEFYDNRTEQVKTILNDEINTGAGKIQQKLPSVFREMSENYEQQLDAISDLADSQGIGLTNKDMLSVIDDTLREVSEEGLDDFGGQALKFVKSLRDRFKVNTITKPSTDLVTGRKVINATENIRPVSLKDAKNTVQRVRQSIDPAFRNGFSTEDLVGVIFNNKWGRKLEQKGLTGLNDLNRSYAPVLRAKKVATKLFRPNQDVSAAKQGAGLIRRVAAGKGNIGEDDILRFIEKGDDTFTKGIGDISKRAKNLSDQIASLQKAKKARKGVISAAGEKRIAALEDKLGKTVREMEITNAVRLNAIQRNKDIAKLIGVAVGAKVLMDVTSGGGFLGSRLAQVLTD